MTVSDDVNVKGHMTRTERSCQSKASQRVEWTENCPQGFDPHRDGSVLSRGFRVLGKSPRLHQDEMFNP